MVLTKEDRIELLKKARQAKANKRTIKEEEEDMEEPVINVKIEEPVVQPETPKVKKTRKKNEVVPLPVAPIVIQEEDVEEDLKPPPRRIPNPKWLKAPKTRAEKVCCDNLTKEEPVITDEKPQVVAETIVIPAKKEIKKPRVPRASTPAKTLDLTDKPRDIADVIEELTVDNSKYLPKVVKPPISIVHVQQGLRLFDY